MIGGSLPKPGLGTDWGSSSVGMWAFSWADSAKSPFRTREFLKLVLVAFRRRCHLELIAWLVGERGDCCCCWMWVERGETFGESVAGEEGEAPDDACAFCEVVVKVW